MILTPLQKLPKNVGELGKLILAKCFEKWMHKVQEIAQSGHTGSSQSKTLSSERFHRKYRRYYFFRFLSRI